jgi:uncharacterized protein (TIGR02594 family)
MNLPADYKFIETIPLPPIMAAALKYYGLKECPGGADNPVILGWAKEFKITWYVHDSTAWCSLYMGKNAKDAGYTPPGPNVLLAAVSWAKWGTPVPFDQIQTGDILVFERPGGHHVALAVAKDAEAYHGWGGNTKDAVGIARLAASRLMAAVRPPGVKAIYPLKKISTAGVLSHNEA